ncbi:MAG: cytochrome C oxidase subunit IV family protein [Chloroflexi bacterium]|nr:cytochrome C oxidase subunit IV family protein [Chloroflexota bacterium]
MVTLAWVVLSLTDWLENPAYVLGVPLAALGVLGLLLVLAPVQITWPQPPGPEVDAARARMDAAWAPTDIAAHEGHPSPSQYIMVGLILGVVTAVEVAVYYVDALEGALLGILMVLSAMKFVLVALWFMHLRFDNRLFSVLFFSGVVLAVFLFVIVLSTLGSSLV